MVYLWLHEIPLLFRVRNRGLWLILPKWETEKMFIQILYINSVCVAQRTQSLSLVTLLGSTQIILMLSLKMLDMPKHIGVLTNHLLTHLNVLTQKIPLASSLKVQLAYLTGSNRRRYHSGPLESAAVVQWQNRLLKMLDRNPHCC